ncbi:MAG: S41 family peptidase, partial [Gammaproteobacteria bacterium]|nr:S41 family peptidase [Gammaproteobacteria bacterium]
MKRLRPAILLFLLIVATPWLHASIKEDRLFEQLSPRPEHSRTARDVVAYLEHKHYLVMPLEDQLSSETFDRYIESLDPARSYFFQKDLDQFKNRQFSLDEELKSGQIDFAFEVFNLYMTRVKARLEYAIDILERQYDDFDFTLNESFAIDREDAPWIQSEEQMNDLWRKRIKSEILAERLLRNITDNQSLALVEDQDKPVAADISKANQNNKDTFEEKRQKIQDLLIKRYKSRYRRIGQTNSEDVFQIYMNALAMSYDPHSQYYSPRATENFNINMSLSLEGIGAVLRSGEDEYTRVDSLIHAGPAEKSGELKPGDRIVAVGQDNQGEMVDVVGWRVDEIVELIRGKKGTVVRLGILPKENEGEETEKIISLVRNSIKIEEQAAKSEIIEIEQLGHTYKIGVIMIPTFYIDFKAQQERSPQYNSSTRDVLRLLAGLKEQNVDGIVIDLRDNGGGSLEEAQRLTGLFIDRGPVVQIRDKNNRFKILPDMDFT